MLTLHTEVTIDAPPTAVWNELSDLEAWSDWNPFITSSEGRLVHREEFTGLLVPLLKRALEGPTQAGFEAMNTALKVRCESR